MLYITGTLLGDVATGLFLTFFATVASIVGILFPLPLALVWILGSAAAFVWLHARSGGRSTPPKRVAVLRLRPLGPAARWIAVCAPAMIVFGLAGGALLQIWAGPIHSPIAPSGANRLEQVAASPGGWFTLTTYAVLTGPLIEEFGFRGWIQRALERRLGAIAAIIGSALLFALAHAWYGRAEYLLIPFVLGSVWGTAVHVTGSLWAGVVLHGVWNGAAMLVVKFAPGAVATLALPDSAPEVLIYALVALAGLAALGWALRHARRRPGRPRGVARERPGTAAGSG